MEGWKCWLVGEVSRKSQKALACCVCVFYVTFYAYIFFVCLWDFSTMHCFYNQSTEKHFQLKMNYNAKQKSTQNIIVLLPTSCKEMD